VAIQKGKRKKRVRRVLDGGVPSPAQTPPVESTPKKPSRRRPQKPLSEKSIVLPLFLTVICVIGAFYGFFYLKSPVWGIGYLVLTVIEGFIAFRIYRARKAATGSE
jgi:hypothetical protein